MKRSIKIVLGVILFIVLACGEDDDTIPLVVETETDIVSLTQNSEIEIFIFANDANIPEQGQLSTTNALKGTLSINQNNTPNNLQDDTIIYTAHPNIIGEDTFNYTICNSAGDCKTERVDITITTASVVTPFTGNNPHQTLSEYHLFEGDLKAQIPSFGVVPYEVITPLFTDYAKKKRFIWMPNGVKASYQDDYTTLDFPEGTIIVKTFYYNDVQPLNNSKLIETRMMYKKQGVWDFANYVWNEEQTEAYLDENASTVNLTWRNGEVFSTVDYQIPSRSQCFTCHNIGDVATPIGPKPQNINKVYAYNTGTNNQLQHLINVGYLNPTIPNTIDTVVDWNDTSESLEDRVRAYLDMNCAHCHSDETHCNYRPIRLAYNATANPDNLGVCITPDTPFIANSLIVNPNNINTSILHYRLNTTEETFRMPLFGRTLKHNEGVALIEAWILSLEACN